MKKLIIKIAITIIALTFLILHFFLSKMHFDTPALILLGIALIPWLYIVFENIEISGIFSSRFRQDDSPKDSVKMPEKKVDDEIVIDFKGSYSIKKNNLSPHLLTFKARINYLSVAGSSNILKIIVNDVLIDEARLKNKPYIKEYNDKRKFPWFVVSSNSWNLHYSPDFFSNYFHIAYHVINGDPYSYMFDITNIQPKEDGLFDIKFIHCGLDEKPAHHNSIVIRELNII